MTDRQLLEHVAVEISALKDGQTRLEDQSKEQLGLLDTIAKTVGDHTVKLETIETTVTEHTGQLQDHTESLETLKESSKHQLDLLDTIAATTGANTSDLLTLTHRKSRLGKIRQ